jgi:hypothetical protein
MGQICRAVGVLAIGLLALGWPYPDARAQAPADFVSALSWPRDFGQGDQRVEIYQPQIGDWSGDRLFGRAAIAIGAKDGQPVYGVARFSADTDIDKTAGLVRQGAESAEGAAGLAPGR